MSLRRPVQPVYTLFSACPSSCSASIKKKHSKETFQKTITKRLTYGKKRPTDYLHLVLMFDMSSIQEKNSQETFERDIQRRSIKETYVYMKKRRRHVRLHVRSVFKRDIRKRFSKEAYVREKETYRLLTNRCERERVTHSMSVFMFGLHSQEVFKRDIQKRTVCVKKRPTDC